MESGNLISFLVAANGLDLGWLHVTLSRIGFCIRSGGAFFGSLDGFQLVCAAPCGAHVWSLRHRFHALPPCFNFKLRLVSLSTMSGLAARPLLTVELVGRLHLLV